MIKILLSILQFLATLIKYLISMFSSLISLIVRIPEYVAWLLSVVTVLPTVLLPFIIGSISVYVVLFVLGRNTS